MSPLGSRAMAVLSAVVAAASVGLVAIFVGGDDEIRPGTNPASIDAGGRRFDRDGSSDGAGNGNGRGGSKSTGGGGGAADSSSSGGGGPGGDDGDISTDSPPLTVPTLPPVTVPTLPSVTVPTVPVVTVP